jgi:putative holliday junction resolvase
MKEDPPPPFSSTPLCPASGATPSKGRVASIDFGLARLGLAISDENRIIAQPVKAIKAGRNYQETALLIAKELSTYSNVKTLVMGLPLLLSGKESDMSARVREFKIVLEEVLQLPVYLWDERLTSQQVEKLLKESNMRRKERSLVCDAVAAATILQSFLSAH